VQNFGNVKLRASVGGVSVSGRIVENVEGTGRVDVGLCTGTEFSGRRIDGVTVMCLTIS